MKRISVSFISMLVVIAGLSFNAHANLIMNGDFSAGLTGWNSTGNVVAALAGPLGTAQGMDGRYALMGFGTTATHTTLWQEFDVTGLDQLTISFNWAFDFIDWSSQYNDAFISLYTQGGFINIIVLQEIVTGGTLQNPQTGLMSGFFTRTIDISGLDGYDGALHFALVENPGWSTESVAGIDNVSVTAAPVPEPATLMLFGSGLLALAGFRRKAR